MMCDVTPVPPTIRLLGVSQADACTRQHVAPRPQLWTPRHCFPTPSDLRTCVAAANDTRTVPPTIHPGTLSSPLLSSRLVSSLRANSLTHSLTHISHTHARTHASAAAEVATAAGGQWYVAAWCLLRLVTDDAVARGPRHRPSGCQTPRRHPVATVTTTCCCFHVLYPVRPHTTQCRSTQVPSLHPSHLPPRWRCQQHAARWAHPPSSAAAPVAWVPRPAPRPPPVAALPRRVALRRRVAARWRHPRWMPRCVCLPRAPSKHAPTPSHPRHTPTLPTPTRWRRAMRR